MPGLVQYCLLSYADPLVSAVTALSLPVSSDLSNLVFTSLPWVATSFAF